MSLRTKINGFTAWVNLRLTPYNQLLNNVLMDLLNGTHMKFFVESFTGRDLRRLENMDGLSQQQLETRVGWVIDELKKCSVLPDDVYVDSRLFAMRSADHVFDLLWRLISHDIWFVWERAEYLQVDDMDVLTQVPFKWTPDPPPKKKKSKKQGKKSLLTGFGPGSAADEKSEDETDSGSEEDMYIDCGSTASREYGVAENFLDDLQTDHGGLQEPFYFSERDLRSDSRYADSRISGLDSRTSELPESRTPNRWLNLPYHDRGSYMHDGLDSRILESVDISDFEYGDTRINGSGLSDIFSWQTESHNRQNRQKYASYHKEDRLRDGSASVNYSGSKKLVNIYIERLKERSPSTDTPSRSDSNPVWEGTHYLMRNYHAQSRISSASSLRSTDSPIKSAPKMIKGKKLTDFFQGNLNEANPKLIQSKKRRDMANRVEKPKIADVMVESAPHIYVNSISESLEEPSEVISREESMNGSKSDELSKRRRRHQKKMLKIPVYRVAGRLCGSEDCRLCCLAKQSTQDQDDLDENWVRYPNAEYVKHFKKKKRDKADYPSPDECVLEMVNYQLKYWQVADLIFTLDVPKLNIVKYANSADPHEKSGDGKRQLSALPDVKHPSSTTRDGKGLFCYSIDDFVDSRVLCALVNSFVPNTFTADLLLNDRYTLDLQYKYYRYITVTKTGDGTPYRSHGYVLLRFRGNIVMKMGTQQQHNNQDRWTINMALKTAEKMFYAETPFDAEDLVEADPMAVCAYFAFFMMVAYRYRQTTAVVNRVDFINMLIRECNHELEKFPPIISNMQELQRRKDLKHELEQHRQALENIGKKFDIDFSRKWVQHVEHVQNELRREIREKMRHRFDIVEIPRNITINDFCLAAVINLSLTNGCGFYLTSSKEQLSEGRRLVLRHRETGEFIEDFTNKSKATIKETLHLPDVTNNVIEINPQNYPNYEFFFEAQSRNKQLKTGTQFLYQVFPGNTVTWQRLFIKSAREAEFETVEKMIAFFKEHSSFINCKEPKSGNTGLHHAARSGHFDIVRLLLENGANVDLKNNFKCTAINFAIEGLQRKICHYLIEWGCDVTSKNIKNQSVLETIKNDEFKRFAMDIYDYYSEIVPRIMNGDMALLDQVIADHISKKREFCCLRSRCINGSTLLHTACYYGHIPAVRELLAQRVDVNLRDYKGATPLHRSKNCEVMELLLDAGAHVNAEDSEGNTPLHVKCYGETNQASETECIEMLLNRNASLIIRNSRGLLPIHCCAMQGRIDVMKMMMAHDQNDNIATALNKENSKKPPSLLHLAIANDFIDCAEWLLNSSFHFKEKEPDILMRRILTEQIKLAKRAEALKFLLDNGADANPKYPGGNTALHYAAGLSGPTDVLDLLITYGAEIDATNEEGCTPLFFSTQSNNKFAACVLIEQGSNVRQKNNQGLTAFDHIVDFEEWIECGYFTEDVKARLKAYNLKHSRDLIRAISKKVKPPGPLGLRQEATRSAFMMKSGPGTIPAITGTGSAGASRHRLLPPLKTAEAGGSLMF